MHNLQTLSSSLVYEAVQLCMAREKFAAAESDLKDAQTRFDNADAAFEDALSDLRREASTLMQGAP